MATVVIKPTQPLAHPFALNLWHIKRKLDRFDIDVEHARRTADGSFIVKLCPEQSPQAVMEIPTFNGVQVSITMPPKLNIIRGYIRHPELAYLSSDDLWEMLSTHDDYLPPEEIIWTMGNDHAILGWLRSDTNVLPSTVLIGYDQVKVKPCLPLPRRCFCCQEYGHIAVKCSKTPVCPRCGEGHDIVPDDPCTRPPHCAACGGGHEVTDPNCQTWKDEKEVVKLQHTRKISYSEALQQKQNQDEEHQKKKQEDERKKKEEHEKLLQKKKQEDEKKEKEEHEKKLQQKKQQEVERKKKEEEHEKKLLQTEKQEEQTKKKAAKGKTLREELYSNASPASIRNLRELWGDDFEQVTGLPDPGPVSTLGTDTTTGAAGGGQAASPSQPGMTSTGTGPDDPSEEGGWKVASSSSKKRKQ